MDRRNHRGSWLLRWSLLLSLGLVSLAAASELPADEPRDAAAAQTTQPLHERIDALIEADHVGNPAPLAGDAEFIRRVYLDLIGRVPPIEEVRSFLADTSPAKRTALVDRLLADPAHAQHLATVFDVMLMERRGDKHVKSPEWREYLLQAFQNNKPLNELAREILAADGVDEKLRPAVKFYLDRDGETNLLTRDTGRVFLGMDLQCAQCHNHPLIDSYLQEDYYGIFAFLNRSFVFEDKKAKKSFFAEKAEGDVEFTSVFTEESGSTGPRLPGSEPIEEPTFAKGEEYVVKPAKEVRPVPKFSRREQLAEQATDGSNEAFNRNWANRLWAHMLGRGLVEPVDLHHPDNPPVHPELLRLLTDELVAMNFNVREFLRQIALTRTYQRGFDMPANLASQAQAARQQLAALKNEQQQCVALAKQADEQHLQAQIARSEAKKAHDEIAPRWRELTEAWEAARAASQAAADELAKSEAALQVKQPAVDPLAAAARQTNQAATKLAEVKSADAAKLQALAKTLQERSQQLAAEVKKLAETRAAQQTARDQAMAKLAETAQGREALAADYQQVKQDLDQQQEALRRQRRASESADDAVRLAERRIEQAERLAELGDLVARVEKLTQQQTALATELSGQRKIIETMELAEAELGQATETLRQLETQHQDLQSQLDSALAQHDEALVALTEDWSRRFAVASLKPLQPEELAWSLMEVSGMLDRYRAAAAAELDKKEPLKEPVDAARRAERDRQIEAHVREKLASQVNAFINLFGAGAGQPQNEFFATVDQALFFANGSQLRGWLAPSGENLTARLAKLETPEEIAKELYLSALCRHPLQAEIDDVTRQLAARPEDKAAVVQDLAWGLLTSAEFRFNH